MPARVSSRSFVSRWTELAPWFLVALLFHTAIFLLAYMAVPAGQADRADVTAIAIVTDPNPYVEGPEDIEALQAPSPAVSETARTEREAPPRESAQPTPAQTVMARNPEPLPPPPAGDTTDDPNPMDALTAEAGTSGGPNTFDPFANRNGSNRGQALASFGGSPETDAAVAAGLKWLAAHQEPDGSWDRLGFNRHCPPTDQCGGIAVRWGELDATPGVTALATLPFLGAGSTHRTGEYRGTVNDALRYLLARQRSNGSFSSPDRMEMYNDAIATIVLAESYALTGDPKLFEPLRSALDHLIKAQQPSGGWDYRSDLRTDRSDTSVTGWVLMALKAASTAGLDIPDRTLLGVVDHFARATEENGLVWYADRGTGTDQDNDGQTLRYGPAMAAVGMLARSWLGFRPDAELLTTQAGLLLGEPPDPVKLKGADPTGLHGYYYWYHGSLAMFLRGGQDWLQWNGRLREAVMAMQDLAVSGSGQPRHTFGSWPALGPGWGKWGRTGSRVYSTAISVLTLETYYRYVPSYASGRPLLTPGALRLAFRENGGTDRLRYAHLAADLTLDVAEPALIDFLAAPEPRVQLVAALALARIQNPLGIEILRSHLANASAIEYQAIEFALDSLAATRFGPDYGGIVRVDGANRLVVFDTSGRDVYFSQPIQITRDSQTIGSAIVVRRSPDNNLAVAKLDSQASAAVGDLIIAKPE